MNAFQQARAELPLMPEAVFKLWLDGRIEANGWPPDGATWSNALRGFPLSFWKHIQWSFDSLELRYESFTDRSQSLIKNLIDATFFDVDNSVREYLGDDSKIRAGKILGFIRAEQRLPGTLVVIEEGGRYELVDGCHRCATYFEAKRRGVSEELLSRKVDAWIGKLG